MAQRTAILESPTMVTAGHSTHAHEDVLHTHLHQHITHYLDGSDASAVRHLVSTHEHPHNHSQVTHAHLPHEDAGREHLHEAHVHDHDHPWSP